MGITNLPEMRDYWSISSITSVPWFRTSFSCGRFEQIASFLHLVNNENTPPRESPECKPYKLASLSDTLSKNYQDCYTPEKELAINEQMVFTKSCTSVI